jgi:adenosylcobinamide-phosphate synthase
LKRTTLLPAAYLFDAIAGDPEWLPHPVRLVGYATSRGEAFLRRPGQSDALEFTLGTVLATAIISGAYGLTTFLLTQSRRRCPILADAVELLLAWTCIAACNLQSEALSVTNALESNDLPAARLRLARIVGRDTKELDAQEISRAVIETVAESASDGTIAPLFYMAIGGVPLAMAYKAVNTLDSMIGHANTHYLYFGKFAARLDDVANFLPARFTALGVVASAQLQDNYDAEAALQVWKRDGAKHKSPNAGQPESATSGALRVKLGGENIYDGESINAPFLGAEFPSPKPQDAVRAVRLISTVSLLGLAAAFLFAVCARNRQKR